MIADLSVNFFERHVLRAGHVVQRVVFDYGYDLYLTVFNQNGEIEPGNAFVQLKATDTPQYRRGDFIVVVLEREHLLQWLQEPMPVFFVVYDATQEQAFWIEVQDQFWNHVDQLGGVTISVRVPLANSVDVLAIERMCLSIRERVRRVRETYGNN